MWRRIKHFWHFNVWNVCVLLLLFLRQSGWQVIMWMYCMKYLQGVASGLQPSAIFKSLVGPDRALAVAPLSRDIPPDCVKPHNWTTAMKEKKVILLNVRFDWLKWIETWNAKCKKKEDEWCSLANVNLANWKVFKTRPDLSLIFFLTGIVSQKWRVKHEKRLMTKRNNKSIFIKLFFAKEIFLIFHFSVSNLCIVNIVNICNVCCRSRAVISPVRSVTRHLCNAALCKMHLSAIHCMLCAGQMASLSALCTLYTNIALSDYKVEEIKNYIIKSKNKNVMIIIAVMIHSRKVKK